MNIILEKNEFLKKLNDIPETFDLDAIKKKRVAKPEYCQICEDSLGFLDRTYFCKRCAVACCTLCCSE